MTEPSAKVRKPYIMTKQREKWSEEEHQKFVEALRLYGRAWRRIEEHIQTKTAVQIRSHAQKFFSKLERESSARFSSSIERDIDIPPPRPKRKPSHPYPRKAVSSALSYSSGAFEKESKSPPAVCSAFTPLRSSVEPSLHSVLIKNGTNVLLHNQTLTSVVDKNERKRAMDTSPQINGFSTSLKLFGQTLVFPSPEKADTYISDILPGNLGPHKNVLHKPSEFGSSGVGPQNEVEVPENSVTGAKRPEAGLKFGTSTACSAGHSKASENSSPRCHYVSSKSTESINQGKDYSLDRHNKPEHIGDLSCFIEFKAKKAAGTVLASVSNNRLPCFSFEPPSICHIQPLPRPVTNANNHEEDPGCIGCTPLDPNPYLQVQDSPTSAGIAVLPSLIPGNSFNHFSDHDKGAATAIAAFAFAAASAWCAVQGGVTSENFPPNKRGRIYTPVAVVASEKPAFLSSIFGLKTEISLRKQDLDSMFMYEAMEEDSTYEENTINAMGENDESTATIKYQASADTQQASEGSDKVSEVASAEVGHEGFTTTEKDIKMPVYRERERTKENYKGLVKKSNAAFPSNNHWERQEEKYDLRSSSGSSCNKVLKQENPTFIGEMKVDCSKLQSSMEDSVSDTFPATDGTVSGALANETWTLDKSKQCPTEEGKLNEQDCNNCSKQEQMKGSSIQCLAEDQYPCSMFVEKDTSSEMHQSTCLKFHRFGLQLTLNSVAIHNECMKESPQAESCDDSKKMHPQMSVAVKTENLKGPERYGGAGFVPYQKFLEDGKQKFTSVRS